MSARKGKVAPTLARLVAADWTVEEARCAQYRREFAALLAVARAAQRHHGWAEGSSPCADPACLLCPVFVRLARASNALRRP